MNRRYSLSLGWAAAVCVVFCVQAAEPVKSGYPSETLWKKAGVPDVRFVLHEDTDLRGLFCDGNTLRDRIRRSVCVIDDARVTLDGEPNAAREVKIEKSITVADLLVKVGFEKRKGVPWRGGQPQMRIIKQNAIIQSPLLSDTSTGDSDFAVESFLNRKLEPGDILIVATIS